MLAGMLVRPLPSREIRSSSMLGIPFNQTKPFRLDIVEHIVPVLGDHLLGLQAGNEPDLYAS